jgi:fluoride ion exporter CrcB/FEX
MAPDRNRFAGSLPTYSAYSVETIRLLERGRVGLGLSYVVLTPVLALAAAFIGTRVGKVL